MKKALKIIGIIIGLLIIAIIVLPIAFKGKIFDMVMEEANKNLNAEVSIGDLDLSLISNFPDFSLTVTDIQVIGKDTFNGVPLAKVGEINASLDLMSVISGDQIQINSFGISDIESHVIVLKDGVANYDIVKASDDTEVEEETSEEVEEVDSEESAPLKIQVKEYFIRNAHVIYDDRQGGMYAELTNFNHEGKGDFTLDEFLLETKTTADAIDFKMDGMTYANKVKADIDFNILMDMPNSKYTFKENSISLNDLTLAFDGWVQMPDEVIDMDLTFNTKKTEFKSILSLVPSAYTADFADVKTAGKLALEGMAKGSYYEKDSIMYLPAFDVKLLVDNASFQYPDLPESANNINIDLRAQNPGGIDDKTIVDINKFHVELAKNPIDFQMHLKTPVSDPDMKGALQAQINLASLKDVIPAEEGESYNGSITADLSFAGKLSSIENEQYENFDAQGKLIVLDLDYSSPDMPYAVKLNKMYMAFSPEFVELSSFEAKVGESDFSANGRIDNMLSYYFHDDALSGSFTLNSNYINVNEFMTEEETEESGETTSTEESTTDSTSVEEEATSAFSVPDNINFVFTSNLKKVLYDQMEITNILGKITVADEAVDMQNLSMNLLKGSMKMSGSYSTKETPQPKIAFNFDMKKIDITETAVNFNTIEKLAPALKSAKGAISTNLNMTGVMDDSLNLVLESVNATGNLLTHNLTIENETLEKIDAALKVDKFNPVTLNDVNIDYTIADGKLTTSPFEVKTGDVTSTVSGYTTLEQQIDYTIDSEVPFDALGSSVGQLASNLAGQLQSFGVGSGNVPEKINVSISVTGDMMDPKVKPNFTGADGQQSSIKETVKETVKEKIEEGKEELKKKAQEEADKLIADAQKQADKLVSEAKVQGNKLREEGKKAAQRIREEADKQANDLVKKASNPIAKIAAEKAGEKLREEADKQAKNVEAEANNKANQLEAEAKKKGDQLIQKAKEEADKKINGV